MASHWASKPSLAADDHYKGISMKKKKKCPKCGKENPVDTVYCISLHCRARFGR